MNNVLKDYLEIYECFPVKGTWKKDERKARHKRLTEWQKQEYLQMPSMKEIMSFMEENTGLIYERPFYLKVIVPLVYKDIENHTIEAVRFLFESTREKDIGSRRDYVEIFCEASGWQFSPYQLIDLALDQEPDNQKVLYYKYKLMIRYMSFSIHEIPNLVLDGMYGAKKEAIPGMLNFLDGFQQVCEKVGKLDQEHQEFIALCRRMYLAWDAYMNHVSKYDGFNDYLEKNHIEY